MVFDSFKQSLAFIADAYNPCILLIALLVCTQMWRKGYHLYWTYLAGAALVVYSIMFIDMWLGIWSYIGLDYSTHTATALAIIIFISQNKSIQVNVGLGFSLIVYVGIMKFLNYHSWTDIVTTVIVVGLLLRLMEKNIAKALAA